MNKKNSDLIALLSVFPRLETLQECKSHIDQQPFIDSMVAFAFNKGLIKQNREKDLENLIAKHADAPDANRIPEEMTFERLFRNKKALLQVTISGRSLTDRVNRLIKTWKIALPPLTNTMLTRLKKEAADTPHKLNALRCLAFWIGHERPNLDIQWNFEHLVQLCQTTVPTQKIDQGVRIGLSLFSRGDVIDQDALAWLKKNIKEYIRSNLGMLPGGTWGKVCSYDITTLYVDFPIEGPAAFPAAFQTGIRKAISIAHQIAVRWALSHHATRSRFLSISIVTGEFANLNNHLLPILNARLPGDPVIRMSDHTYRCILIGDIRTVFCSQPESITLFNGEPLGIWWVEALWSAIYWDFIPELLEAPVMQGTQAAKDRLNRFFMVPGQQDTPDDLDPVKQFYLFPQNRLLGIEIAKTLYYRRCFSEANEILRTVLSIDPASVSARSLRMMIFRNMAIEELEYSVSSLQFRWAEDEAGFILDHCDTKEEDFFCEFAVISLTRAINILQRMRAGQTIDGTGTDTDNLKSKVFNYLNRAICLFKKGLVVSPTGYRSSYLFICTHLLVKILSSRPDFFEHPEQEISVPQSVFRQSAFDILASLNYFGWRTKEKTDFKLLEKILMQTFVNHDGSGTLRAYRPTLYFCFSVMLWDVFPRRTVKAVKTVLKFLDKAIQMARALEAQNLYIYSYTRCLGEMLRPETFIRHIQNAQQRVTACAGSLEALEKKNPEDRIEDNDKDFTLFSLNI